MKIFNFLKPKIQSCSRRLVWYNFYSSAVVFKGVVVGKKRKCFFGKEYLVLWRDDLGKKASCVTEWLHESTIIDRD